MSSDRALFRRGASILALLCLVPAVAAAQPRPARRPAPKPAAPPAPFTTTLTLEQMKGKQAVLQTDAGEIVLQLLPEVAPNHVGYFMKLAGEGGYDGTVFHRMIKYGIIQGGDPLSKDPANADRYGTGGLGVLKREPNPEKHTRGAVSAVLQPGRPDSAGAQFFICIADQPALDGEYTVFARVVEGIEVAQTLSETPTGADGKATERVTIRTVTIRDTPPPEPTPFADAAPAELVQFRVVLETTLGPIAIEFFPDLAPGHVRNFLRLAQTGVYDGTIFHRVVPGFVVQGGMTTDRAAPLTTKQQKWVGSLPPEFNATKHQKGIVSMARTDDPNSASTSFFICLGDAPSLDGKYTVFGRVVSGMENVEKMQSVERDGETPRTRIEVTSALVQKK